MRTFVKIHNSSLSITQVIFSLERQVEIYLVKTVTLRFLCSRYYSVERRMMNLESFATEVLYFTVNVLFHSVLKMRILLLSCNFERNIALVENHLFNDKLEPALMWPADQTYHYWLAQNMRIGFIWMRNELFPQIISTLGKGKNKGKLLFASLSIRGIDNNRSLWRNSLSPRIEFKKDWKFSLPVIPEKKSCG